MDSSCKCLVLVAFLVAIIGPEFQLHNLIPRCGGGGGEGTPGTHCLRMRLIIGKATW